MIVRFEVCLKFFFYLIIGGCKNIWEIIFYLVLFLFIDRVSIYDCRLLMVEIVKVFGCSFRNYMSLRNY